MHRFGRVQQRGAAVDTDGLKVRKRPELHREQLQLDALVENQTLKTGQMLHNVIGHALDASAAEVELNKMWSSCRTVSTRGRC